MNIIKHLLCIISATLISTVSHAKLICGTVTDENGMPMSAVIIEQEHTEKYAISDLDGSFCIETDDTKRISLCFRFIGYFTRRIDVSEDVKNDTIKITMLPGNDNAAHKFTMDYKNHIGGFALHFGYDFHKSLFDQFTELSPTQIKQLNNNAHYVCLGLSAYIRNIYAKLDFGISPLRKTVNDLYRHLTESYTISAQIGYGFNLLKDRAIILTPYIGINHLSYNEYVAPRNHSISFEDYLKNGYVDYSILQYTGSVGINLSFRILRFGYRKQQGIYISGGADYNFKMHKHPYMFTRATDIYSNSLLTTSPFNAHITLQWMIFTKQSGWFNKTK